MTNKQNFFNTIRHSLFGGKLLSAQVAGMEAVLQEWEIRELTDNRWLAYILATIFHETGATMQPIEEIGKGASKPYGKKLKYGKGPGKRVPYTEPDHIYYGRGHVQATWFEIYEKLTDLAKKQGHDWDFLNHPELMLQMAPSIWATFEGMTKGLYTGRKLSQSFNTKANNPLGARAIINGENKMVLIKGYYEKFLDSILS